MKLTWVNHASFIIEHGSVKLMCDPWIEGRVFNQSWALLAPTQFLYEEFASITHIWFSHEHPDHFFPPNIKKIPAEFRKNITVIFQKTIDKRVLDFCQKMNFKAIVELTDYTRYFLEEDFTITIGKVKNDTDSWMVMDVGGKRILNLNDCVLEDNERVELRAYTKNIDLLLTQFSFASWIGNKNDVVGMRKHAQDKLEEVKLYIDTFKPTFTIPFASYVWFSHVDNFHFNAFANSVDTIEKLIRSKQSIPVVLYPGDVWKIGDANHQNESALNTYQNDLKKLNTYHLTNPDSVQIDDLKLIALDYTKRCLAKNNKLKLYTYAPFSVYLTDLKRGCKISYKDALIIDPLTNDENADISMHSQSLSFCLQNEYGFDTILIAGTFEKPVGGNFHNFMEYEWISTLNNQGKRMDGLVLRIFKKLIGK